MHSPGQHANIEFAIQNTSPTQPQDESTESEPGPGPLLSRSSSPFQQTLLFILRSVLAFPTDTSSKFLSGTSGRPLARSLREERRGRRALPHADAANTRVARWPVASGLLPPPCSSAASPRPPPRHQGHPILEQPGGCQNDRFSQPLLFLPDTSLSSSSNSSRARFQGHFLKDHLRPL